MARKFIELLKIIFNHTDVAIKIAKIKNYVAFNLGTKIQICINLWTLDDINYELTC